jgi:siroheme synthase-like protein
VRRTAAERAYEYFPAFLDIVGKRAIVVGGGEVAAGKVRALLPCGAAIGVIAPTVCPTIAEAAEAGRLDWLARTYLTADVVNAALVFAATDDRAVNAQVAIDARQAGALILAVDDVPHCDFIAPALVRRDGLVVAISTNGRSPAVARRVREWLEGQLPTYWGMLLDAAAGARNRLRTHGCQVSPEDWQRALSIVETTLTGDRDDLDATRAEQELLRALTLVDRSNCTDELEVFLDRLNKAGPSAPTLR